MKKVIILLSILSGVVWGVVGANLAREAWGAYVYWAIPLSGFIGFGVWQACKNIYRKSLLWLIPLTPLSLLLAPLVFGLILALLGLVDPQKKEGIEFLFASPYSVIWGLFKYDIFWKLLPWAFGNHLVFWYLYQIDEKYIQAELSTPLRAPRSTSR